MQKRAIEICCYVAAASAFGVFVRWLQTQAAFNEEGLVNKSVWNVLVPLLIAGCVYLFMKFADGFKNGRYYAPEYNIDALANPGRLYSVLCIIIGAMMSVGALLLLVKCDGDRNVGFLRVLSVLGVLTGPSFVLLMRSYNDPEAKSSRQCLLATVPIVLFAVWLVTCYKMNDTNSVIWDYAIEILAVCAAMAAFFRLAGFAYGAPNVWRSLFFSMMGTVLLVMSLADERYLGMQIMLISAALMLIYYTWVLVINLRRSEFIPEPEPDDGFDRL